MVTLSAELSASPMRFFTPELFLRVNSADDETADAAHEEWERVSDAYRLHLKKVLRGAPRGVAELAQACYHDASVRGPLSDVTPISPPPITAHGPAFKEPLAPATLTLTIDDRSAALAYLLWDAVRVSPPVHGWADHKDSRLWLYDEVDEVWAPFGMYVHRVLLSSGEVLEFPFYHAIQFDPAKSATATKPARSKR